MFGEYLMEELCERGNMRAALQQVRANKGAPGIDAMHVEELPAFLKAHWLAIKEQLLQGTYQPQLIKRVEIPKPGSREKRKLGIPMCPAYCISYTRVLGIVVVEPVCLRQFH